MKKLLSQLGYSLNATTQVWSRADYVGIAYNYGDEVENRLAEVFSQAQDLSVLSTELRQHCLDWPSTYHLSAQRSNLLRPFQSMLAGADVLEIGTGCGAITRYLGECGANVLALEGPSRRSAIIWLDKKMMRRQAIKVCTKSSLFDADWYLTSYPDVKSSGMNPVTHFVVFGATEGRDPGPFFSTHRYLLENPTLKERGINPLFDFEKSKGSGKFKLFVRKVAKAIYHKIPGSHTKRTRY